MVESVPRLWEHAAKIVHQENFHFETTGHWHMIDVTDRVVKIVSRSGVKTGIVQINCVGSTAAVGAIEFEPGLERDLPKMLDRLIPPSRDYGHEQACHDGTTATAIRTCKPRFSAPPCLFPSPTTNSSSAPETNLPSRMRRSPPPPHPRRHRNWGITKARRQTENRRVPLLACPNSVRDLLL
jgi:hypothetical protein